MAGQYVIPEVPTHPRPGGQGLSCICLGSSHGACVLPAPLQEARGCGPQVGHAGEGSARDLKVPPPPFK